MTDIPEGIVPPHIPVYGMKGEPGVDTPRDPSFNSLDNGLTSTFLIRKTFLSKLSLEDDKDELYKFLDNSSHVVDHYVKGEFESWFTYRMFVRISFRNTSAFNSLKYVVKSIGAELEEVILPGDDNA